MNGCVQSWEFASMSSPTGAAPAGLSASRDFGVGDGGEKKPIKRVSFADLAHASAKAPPPPSSRGSVISPEEMRRSLPSGTGKLYEAGPYMPPHKGGERLGQPPIRVLTKDAEALNEAREKIADVMAKNESLSGEMADLRRQLSTERAISAGSVFSAESLLGTGENLKLEVYDRIQVAYLLRSHERALQEAIARSEQHIAQLVESGIRKDAHIHHLSGCLAASQTVIDYQNEHVAFLGSRLAEEEKLSAAANLDFLCERMGHEAWDGRGRSGESEKTRAENNVLHERMSDLRAAHAIAADDLEKALARNNQIESKAIAKQLELEQNIRDLHSSQRNMQSIQQKIEKEDSVKENLIKSRDDLIKRINISNKILHSGKIKTDQQKIKFRKKKEALESEMVLLKEKISSSDLAISDLRNEKKYLQDRICNLENSENDLRSNMKKLERELEEQKKKTDIELMQSDDLFDNVNKLQKVNSELKAKNEELKSEMKFFKEMKRLQEALEVNSRVAVLCSQFKSVLNQINDKKEVISLISEAVDSVRYDAASYPEAFHGKVIAIQEIKRQLIDSISKEGLKGARVKAGLIMISADNEIKLLRQKIEKLQNNPNLQA